MPSDADEGAAEKRIREIYRDEFAAGRVADKKRKLATKLFDQGVATTDDPTARFVLWRLAADISAESGELAKSLESVDKLDGQYRVNGLGMKADSVGTAVKSLRGPVDIEIARQLLTTALSLADAASAQDQFDIALRFVKSANVVGHRLKDAQVTHDLALRKTELDRRKAKFSAVRKALDALAENPADVEANSVAGQWHCFVKGDWEKGLPLLAKGKNAGLADLAARDLAQPSNAREQVQVADGWWAAAEKESGSAKSVVQARAVHWYELALPRLAGLDRAKVAKRLEIAAAAAAAAGETLLPTGPAVRSVVQAGDVALAKNGAKVQGPTLNPDALLDGNSTDFDRGHGYAWSETPCEWIITLDKIYRLREIRFRLYDKDDRISNYILLVSTDGSKYVQVADRSRGVWKSWQSITFTPHPVKTIKLVGVAPPGANKGALTVVELEAYCFPPGPPPK